ncbi:EF-P lysine aminoacylase EpmA [Beggiatoa leptomitoformis]|uniref:EF-P lysine aminoacylase GenX n=1 Tax=Beggiatoa leptomitoformis TaxID=288004 RepID=A0A2N9YEN5_9GAMM|nr:EF-P lysine aminoacylase EpmA [Beggiatoa leptomitoformis]ALG68699.1 EF-P lysine aminoacylase GenX [Beggiatoa leptomitoformis]AUI68948.1 EF-P lysine aminoacylase GenX [Beggiatoa leptomitoformis]
MKTVPSLPWQPSATLAVLRSRSQFYQTIRAFFQARDVWEVETPILSSASVPEPMIAPFHTYYHGDKPLQLFLQTSPELPMKRLLASGSGAIFQICKVFRDGEAGKKHNPEFSLLEWYRPHFSLSALIDEVSALLQTVLACSPVEIVNYCDVFQQYTGLHPLHTPLEALQYATVAAGLVTTQPLDRDSCLQFLMSVQVEPHIGKTCPTVVQYFPATQAALARKCLDNPQLAERFEVYFQGMELANGFHELADPIEQRRRFIEDLQRRADLQLPQYPIDENFLTALHSGLPDCAGVAIGLDRLLMLKVGAQQIQQVLAFSVENA